MQLRNWKCWTVGVEEKWEIEWDGHKVIATSDKPKINIRQGLYIEMGNGRLIIEARIP